ncbi:glycosyltransferase family 2 protein [Vibrio mangrovi]|uniref:Glycosyltransferase family 2 protein n=1 Tax=Vibrio mangrovi TaxID=474394 RepID=A0A1Y6IV59_9VIBR|nr:glycosyltransferase family 2 protein [Vibrio mangrovi]MDW6002199.1 glycosyltransferase family 2 protein [Vibrio mangrovi]SMS01544.1 hypothetical protein VIM7927_02840 [Vibrio mangrovi]
MIVIPMAGLSSRFFNAGYEKPKYMLEAHGSSLFEHSVNSFKRYFDNEFFLFVVHNMYETKEFVNQKCVKLGIKNYEVYELRNKTRGQAETVATALNDLKLTDMDSLVIFNIDTFRPNFYFPTITDKCDGYLEVFKGEGEHWSFALCEQDDSDRVIKTTEKERISEWCSTGLYYFKSASIFLDAYNSYIRQPKETWAKGEIYIAPLYNFLIKENYDIRINPINSNDVIFCGTPSEYTDYLDREL